MAEPDDTVRHPLVRALVEIAAAIVLSVAALLTTWASFQAALWDGEQAAAYTQAGAARVKAGVLATQNGQYEGVDLLLFTQWLDAHAREDRSLDAFYEERFRPEFARAFRAWLALKPLQNPAAPRTPFQMADYAPHLAGEAKVMDRNADALFDKGQQANEISDSFVQATVILALALFLGGIGQTFRGEGVRLVLSGLGAAACAVGAYQLVSLPALSLG